MSQSACIGARQYRIGLNVYNLMDDVVCNSAFDNRAVVGAGRTMDPHKRAEVLIAECLCGALSQSLRLAAGRKPLSFAARPS